MAIRTCNIVLATCNKFFVRQVERKIFTCNSRGGHVQRDGVEEEQILSKSGMFPHALFPRVFPARRIFNN